MSGAGPQAVTQLLARLQDGTPEAAGELIPIVYTELHKVAERCLRRERPGHTLQPTALVNEAYIRLVGQRDVAWQSRVHFFSLAATLMRRILLDYARRRRSSKRGGGGKAVTLDESFASTQVDLDQIAAVDEALSRLEKVDARQARLVELRFFAGLSVEEAAEVLGVAPITVKREWSHAKAWLRRELASIAEERERVRPSSATREGPFS